MNEKVKKLLMALIQAAQSGDQKAIQAIQQIKQQADQGDQQAAALMEAMTAIAQQMQQSAQPTQPVTARLGAKLNYIRTIKGECPEGQKLVYFKEGGRVCKKCVEAAGGAKVKDGKKEIADFKKQRGCKGMKTRKKQIGGSLSSGIKGSGNIRDKRVINPGESAFEEDPVPDLFILKTLKQGGEVKGTKKACGGRKFEDGGKSQKPKYTKDQIAGRTPVKVVNGVKYFLNGDGQVVKDPKGKNSGSWTLEDDNKMLKYRLKGTKNPSEKRDSILNQMKWNNLPESEKKKHEVQELKCGGKAKKHLFGGILGF